MRISIITAEYPQIGELREALTKAGSEVSCDSKFPEAINVEIVFLLGSQVDILREYNTLYKAATKANCLLWLICTEPWTEKWQPWRQPGVCFSAEFSAEQIVSSFRQKPIGKR